MTDETTKGAPVGTGLEDAEQVGEESGELVVQAQELIATIDSEEAYAALVEMIRTLRTTLGEIASAFDPICQATHAAWKTSTDMRKAYRDPIEEAIRAGNNSLSAYRAEQKRLAKVSRQKLIATAERELDRLKAEPDERGAVMARVTELIDKHVDDEDEIADTIATGLKKFRVAKREAKEQAERRRREAEEKRAAEWDLLSAAEEIDAVVEAVEAVEVELVAPEPEEAPEVVPPPPADAGTYLRRDWSVKVSDLKALCRAVADGKVPSTFVKPDLSKIRTTMLSVPPTDRSGIDWPGVDVSVEEIVVVQSGSE
jgi:chromosome segregation ATPase